VTHALVFLAISAVAQCASIEYNLDVYSPNTTTSPAEWESISGFLEWWLENPVLEREDRTAFDRYYASYRKHFGAYARHHYENQTSEVRALISRSQAPKLLEVGCGCGTEALWFALRGARTVAVDIHAKRLAVARARQAFVEGLIGRRLPLEFRHQSLFDIEDCETFDIIWMEQVFHHIEPRVKVYATVSRFLAPGGSVVISEANGWNPVLQGMLFRKRGLRVIVDRKSPSGGRELYGDERITIPSALTRGFRTAGVERESVRYFRTLPNVPIADGLLPFEGAVPRFAPLFTHYNFVGRKTRQPC
jgi:SAM-dependent methyltransferase